MEGHASNASCVSLNLSAAIKSSGNRFISMSQKWIRLSVLRHSRVPGDTLFESALCKQSWLICCSITIHLLALVLSLNFFLNPLFIGLDCIFDFFCLLLKFVFLELEKGLLLSCVEKLLFDILNFFFDLFVTRFDIFYCLVDLNFFLVNAGLMGFMVITFF